MALLSGGGALIIFDSQGEVTNTTFERNTAAGYGGAIFMASIDGGATSLAVDGCTISGNTAVDSGGGIYIGENGVLTSNNTDWSGNSPNAIAIDGGTSYGSSSLGSYFLCYQSRGACESY